MNLEFYRNQLRMLDKHFSITEKFFLNSSNYKFLPQLSPSKKEDFKLYKEYIQKYGFIPIYNVKEYNEKLYNTYFLYKSNEIKDYYTILLSYMGGEIAYKLEENQKKTIDSVYFYKFIHFNTEYELRKNIRYIFNKDIPPNKKSYKMLRDKLFKDVRNKSINPIPIYELIRTNFKDYMIKDLKSSSISAYEYYKILTLKGIFLPKDPEILDIDNSIIYDVLNLGKRKKMEQSKEKDVLDINKELFVEKYRPQTLEDIVLPLRIKNKVKDMVKSPEAFPNLLLYGPAGTGKTSLAKILIKELKAESLEINGSLDTSIDIVRYKVEKFSSQMSLSGSVLKVVFVTEADGFSTQAQNALKNIIEKYSKNVRFIFDTNYKDKLVQPLISRTGGGISFNFTKEEKREMARDYFKKLKNILDLEGIKYNIDDLKHIIMTQFPDMRNILVNIQMSIENNKLVLSKITDKLVLTEIVQAIKNKDFSELRQAISKVQNYDNTIVMFFKEADNIFKEKTMPTVFKIISEYAYTTNMSISKEINFCGLCSELFLNPDFLK